MGSPYSYISGTPKDSWGRDVESVSMVALIANPERYDGKTVQVVGYANIAFEGDALYLNEQFARKKLTQEALALVLPADDVLVARLRKHFHKRYCVVTGVFHAAGKGHMDLFAGSVRDLRGVALWPDR